MQSKNCHKHLFSVKRCAVTGFGIKAFAGQFGEEKKGKKKKKKEERQLIFYLFTAQQNQKVVASKPHVSRPYPGAVAAWVSKGCADSNEGLKRQHPKAKQVKGTNYVRAKCSCLRSPLLLFGLLSPGDLSRRS